MMAGTPACAAPAPPTPSPTPPCTWPATRQCSYGTVIDVDGGRVGVAVIAA